jgi:hypothetical protein
VKPVTPSARCDCPRISRDDWRESTRAIENVNGTARRVSRNAKLDGSLASVTQAA